MNLPLLLLGLYVGLLALSLALSSWVGHALPPPDAARRVTDAAERAALMHLASPTKLALGALVLFSALSAASTWLFDGSSVSMFLAPLLGSALVLGAIFYSARKLLRGAAQVVGAQGTDQRIGLCSRSLLAAVLCCESTVALVLLGTFALFVPSLGQKDALRLVMVSAAGIGLSATIYARAATGALLASHPSDNHPGPHPASLARLVSQAFHGPSLRLLTLVTLTAFGHLILLLFAQAEDAPKPLWLYPHLLKWIGLLALVFGAMVVRSSESERNNVAWIRGGLVSLILLIAGAWSLSVELPEEWARVVPSGLTFFFLAAVLFIWINGSFRGQSQGLAGAQLRRVPAALVLVSLLGVLVFSIQLLPADAAIPASALLRLMVAAALSLSPLSVVWLLARDLGESYRHIQELSYINADASTAAPSSRFASLFPVLTLVALSSALGGMLLVVQWSPPGGFVQSLGWFLGALLLWGLVGLAERSSEAHTLAIFQLLHRHDKQPAAEKLNLELAVETSKQATLGGLPWLVIALSPTILVVLLSFLVPPTLLRSLILGLSLGSLFIGIGLDWSFSATKSGDRRAVGALSHITSLSQTLWLVAIGMHIS